MTTTYILTKQALGKKIVLKDAKGEAGRATLYILTNDLRDRPFGLIEDVFIREDRREDGLMSKLMKTLFSESEKNHCYKLICTARDTKPDVQMMYQHYGFQRHGAEFRQEF